MTRVGMSQMAAPAEASASVIVTSPAGAFLSADIGAGIVLDQSGARPVLRLADPRFELLTLDFTDPNKPKAKLTYVPFGPPIVTSNGLVQEPGYDYVATGQEVEFQFPVDAGARVTVRYRSA